MIGDTLDDELHGECVVVDAYDGYLELKHLQSGAMLLVSRGTALRMTHRPANRGQQCALICILAAGATTLGVLYGYF